MDVLHPALEVHDLDTTVAFYVDLLGLDRTREAELGGQRHVFLGGTGPAELQLMEVDDPVTPSGFDHLAVAADDIDAVVEAAIEEWDSAVVREPDTFEDVRLAFITDPEGYHVELIEELEPAA